MSKEAVSTPPVIKKKRKLVHLPGTKLSPEVVLRRCLEDIDETKSVIVIVQDKNDFYDCIWSQMQLSELSFAIHTLENEFRETVNITYSDDPTEGDISG